MAAASFCRQSRGDYTMTNSEPVLPIEILLVEDNPGDIELTRIAFASAKIYNTLNVVERGDEVMPYLRREGRHANAHRPGLILLDLNLPGKDGREVLIEIKGDEDLTDIPVIILTTSKTEEDIMKSYRLHANGYIQKPVDLTQFVDAMVALKSFWLTVVKLPNVD